jgi:hypothetical protein
VNKPASLFRDQHIANGLSLESIPTNDAEAALRFCRALARQLFNAESVQLQLENSSNYDQLSAGQISEPEVSIVIPVYNEGENIPVLYERLTEVLHGAQLDFEIIFVDDGSTDNSAKSLKQIENSDNRVVVVELARNFGHQVAITAGLDHARGYAVAVMDADLQDPPEVLPQFIDKWREGQRCSLRDSGASEGGMAQKIQLHGVLSPAPLYCTHRNSA